MCLHVFKYSAPCSLVSSPQRSEKIWDLAQAAPAAETDVCCLACTHVCLFHRLLSIVHLQSQCLPFPILDGWKKMWIITFSQNQSASVLSTAISLSNWESPCALIADWIWERKHQGRFFLMWFRFSSIQVYIVNLLHHRAHVIIADFRPKLTGVF